MSKRDEQRRRERTPRVRVIQACMWCGAAFAHEFSDGYFCNIICASEWRKDQRMPPGTRTETVEQCIIDAEDDRTD